MFAFSAQLALSGPETGPARRRATEALPPGGTVLDVGAGGGAASLPLAPPAGMLVAVDESRDMLDVFAGAAAKLGVGHAEIAGRWPDVAGRTPDAAVVVCRHVVYNVPDLAPFLVALDAHAQVRVVVELTELHPQSDLNPLWEAVHGIERPGVPTAQGAADVAVALGYEVHLERCDEPSLWHQWPRDERVGFARRRLCLGPERDAEIGALLDRATDVPRRVVTLWWDHAGAGRPRRAHQPQ
jgi:SAM-dependent methyltransferase